MINPLKALGDLNQMRQQAMQMQKELAAERITIDKDGVHVVMSGDQKILEFTIDGHHPEDRVTNALQDAIQKVQEVAASKLARISGGLQGLIGK
jgi:DNA-binding protein YbaB